MTSPAHISDPPQPPSTSGRIRDRLLGLSGLAFVAALLPVVVIPHASLDYPIGQPPAGSVITQFFHQHYALEQWQALMHSLAALALLVFGVALARQLRRATPESPASSLLLAGTVLAASVMLITMLLVAGTITQTGGVGGVTQGWLYNLAWDTHFKMLYAVPLVLLPASRVLPRLLGGAGWVLAALAMVAMVAVINPGTEFLQFPVFFLLMLWIGVTGLVALTRGLPTAG
jgi:hypothetical protein